MPQIKSIFLLCLVICLPSTGFSQSSIARPELINAQAEAAIARGAAFLARTQNGDGSWAAKGRYSSTMAALAGLALIANGNTPVSGKYAKHVEKATGFLIKNTHSNGLIAKPGQESHSMHGHGFALQFLGQVYGMESNPIRQREIARVIKAAIKLTEKSQSKDGGWLYQPNSNSDEGSVTVTQLQGLRACREAGFKVSSKTIERACIYIDKCANKDGGIAYSLRSRGASRPAITAAAVATLYSGGKFDHPVAKRCLDFSLKLLNKNDMDLWKAYRGHSFYSLLYVGQAMWFTNEKYWKAFFPKTRDRLISLQSADGSWNGDHVGTAYGTAIALLIMQLPYNYLTCFQR